MRSWPGWILLWVVVYLLAFPKGGPGWVGAAGAGMSLAGSSWVGDQQQTPCPALGDQGAQNTLLLLARLWAIPRIEGLSCGGAGSAGRMGTEMSVLSMAGADGWKDSDALETPPGSGIPLPLLCRSRGVCIFVAFRPVLDLVNTVAAYLTQRPFIWCIW